MIDVALILAAGGSSRLGQPKQLVVVEGETLVARAVRIAREAALVPVVVTGCEAEAVAAATDAQRVHHAAWADGIGSSIAAGVQAIAARAASITVMTCDQFAITAADLKRLAEADREVAAASYHDVIGVPARFQPSCYDELARLEGDVGAQKLLRGGQFDVVSVPMERAELDVDEPEDLEGFR